MSSCKFPNHLCHLLDMPRANIPVWYCGKNITHIVLSHIHVLIHLASLQRGEPFQPDCRKLPRTSPFLFLGKQKQVSALGKLMRWPGSRARPSLPARGAVSDPSISRSTNQGNKTKAWHRRCVTAYRSWGGTLLPYQLAWPAAQSLRGVRKNAGYAWGKKDKRERAPENPRANGQEVIEQVLVPLKPWRPADLKSFAHELHLLKNTPLPDTKLSPGDEAIFKFPKT